LRIAATGGALGRGRYFGLPRLKTVYLTLAGAPAKLLEHNIEKVQPQSGTRVLLKLQGIERIEEAEPLRGAQLPPAPGRRLPALEDDQFYLPRRHRLRRGRRALGELGTVENFYELPQQDMLAMRYQGQEVLIPVVDELVSHADHADEADLCEPARRLARHLPQAVSRERDEPDELTTSR
ncbi:MAG: hypothetical protein WKG07_11640, partial [Hymenobacter sp.]